MSGLSTARNALRQGYVDSAREIVKKAAPLPELSMRSATLVEQLRGMGAVRAVWTLETLIRGALRKEEPSVEVYMALLDPDVVTDQLEAENVDAMVQAGVEETCVAAVQWLRSGTLVDEPGGRELSDERLVDRDLREMTLGHRRSMARRASGDMLDKLLQDPDPGVITNLLNNPRVTEQTVLKITSRRPTVSAALEAVLASPRWNQRYRVKMSLVRNPYLRLRYGVNLLVLANHRDLKDLARDESLSPMLRLAAQRLLDLL